MTNQSAPPSDYDASEFIRAHWPAPSVLLLALNRPPVNAFSSPFWKALGSIFRSIQADPHVRAVILCSDIRIFTAGLDLKEDGLNLVGSDPARSALLLRAHVAEFQAAITAIEDCERPVIAAVHGACYGLGIDIISACDIRFCDSKTKFSIKEVDAGVAADIGTLQRLPKKTGNDSLLRELALTARAFDVREACELGLLSQNQVVQGGPEAVRSRAIELAKEIAAKSPVAILGTKHLLNYSVDHSVKEGLQYTSIWSGSALQADDFRDSMEKSIKSKDPSQTFQTKFKPLSKL